MTLYNRFTPSLTASLLLMILSPTAYVAQTLIAPPSSSSSSTANNPQPQSKSASSKWSDLPPDRFPAAGWQDIKWHDPGGWTTIDVTAQGLAANSPEIDAASKIKTIVDRSSARRVLYFPAGTYYFKSVLQITESNIILRGAGPDKTRFLLLKPNAPGRIIFTGSISPVTSPLAVAVSKGATRVQLTDASSYRVGDLIQIYQSLPKWAAEWGRYSWGQHVFVTAKIGNTLTIDMPLGLAYDPAQGARAAKLEPIQNIGVENINIENGVPEVILPNTDDDSHLLIQFAHNGYVKRVRSYLVSGSHIQISDARRIIVSQCYLEEGLAMHLGGHGYGVHVDRKATRILVTDNIMRHLRHHISVNAGANHSVFSYNFHTELGPRGLADVSVHGHYSYNNLFEGNIVQWIESADYWGQSGPGTTFFRNKTHGNVSLKLDSDAQNVIGNVLTNNGTIKVAGDVDDTYAEGNTINGRVTWTMLNPRSTLPSSLYLTAKPEFWPSDLAWPAFGPRVSVEENNKIPAQIRYENGTPFSGVSTTINTPASVTTAAASTSPSAMTPESRRVLSLRAQLEPVRAHTCQIK